MKSFSQVCEIFITIILLFLVPLLCLSCQQELLLQNYAQNKVIYFIDSVRNVGYINQGMYDSFLKSLQLTNHVYEVELSVYEKYRNSGSDHSYLLGTYTDDILETIYEEKELFIMHQGDYISIAVRRKDYTKTERFLMFLGVTNISSEAIPIQYGGMIRDECF